MGCMLYDVNKILVVSVYCCSICSLCCIQLIEVGSLSFM